MIAKIEPSLMAGRVEAPPSKSMAHRLLICAGLAKGESVIHGIDPSEDVMATLDCLKAIGAEWSYVNNTVTVKGAALADASFVKELFCRESGSTLRFFIPICLVAGGESKLYGSEKLLSRPLGVYENICKKSGIGYEAKKDRITLSGKLSGGEYRVPGNVSSQFISGLLFALPLLSGDSTVVIAPPIESCSYIKLTIQALSMFGVEARWVDERTLFIPGSQSYFPREVTVEGDYSNAAFFDALNYLGGKVTVEGLREDSIQGDKVYRQYFEMMTKGTPSVNISDCPDLGPVLFAVAAAHGGGVFTGTARLKIKESDRGAAMAAELAKFGTSVRVSDDSVVIYPAEFKRPAEAIHGHNDHRIVMATAILLAKTGGTIIGAEAVNKSFPDFFERMKSLGMDVKLYDE